MGSENEHKSVFAGEERGRGGAHPGNGCCSVRSGNLLIGFFFKKPARRPRAEAAPFGQPPADVRLRLPENGETRSSRGDCGFLGEVLDLCY